jgi:two-component system response regulator TctD
MQFHAQASLPTPRAPTRRLRIVVADDDRLLRGVVADVLRAEGHEVEEVADGEALLLRVVRSFAVGARALPAIDLIISDVCMPRGTGLDVVRRLRGVRKTTPVVLMSGSADGGLAARARELDAGFLEKPFTVDALRATMSEALRIAPPR